MAAVWCSFDSNLCSLIFYSCSLSSYLFYPLYLFPSTNIFCLYPPHPISRYFCKESLMTPPPHWPTSSLFTVTVTPPKILIVLFPSFSICVHSFSIRVHSFSIRVHSCTIRVHSCSFVFIRVPFVFTRVPFVFHSCSLVFHSCSFVFTRVHSCSLVFIRVHSCSFVFIRVHSCSFVFRSVWCFRYDPSGIPINTFRKQRYYFRKGPCEPKVKRPNVQCFRHSQAT